MKRQGSNLYMLTAFILGLGLGLIVSLWLSPLQSRNSSPASLSAMDKDAYRVLIAQVYSARGDMERAQARLALLGDKDSHSALAAQAQRAIANGHPAEEARSLALLAAALNVLQQTPLAPTEAVMTLPPAGTSTADVPVQDSPEPVLSTETIPVSQPTDTAEPARTQAIDTVVPVPPTIAPTPTQVLQFVVASRQSLCDVELMQMLQVTVVDAAGRPLAGQGITISWEGGSETFFTGLKTREGAGFADYTMAPDGLYNLRMAAGGETARDISAPNCRTDAGMDYKGGVVITFALQ